MSGAGRGGRTWLVGALVGLGACAAVPGPDDVGATAPATTAVAPDPALFDYDEAAPAHLTVLSSRVRGPVSVAEVRYPSPRGGPDVTATLSRPLADPVAAAVLLLHGMPLDRRDMRVPGMVYACAGATALAIDAPYVRIGQGAIKLDRRDRAEQVQHVTDLRRGIDLLQREGADRVGAVGLSHGASMTALLAGVDDRLDSAVLLVGDGGLVAHLTDDDGTARPPLDGIPQPQQQRWLEAMRPVEPLLYLPHSDADLLLLNGRSDTLVDVADAEDLHEAAGPDATARWYDAGHDLTPEAFRYQFDWLGERLRLDPDRLDRCVADLARLPDHA